MSADRHWASAWIGRPYTEAFRCWDLVRLYFKERHGVEMPEHAAGVLNLRTAAQASGWRPVKSLAAVDDVVVMTDPRGERHVGVFIEADGKVGVLHNDGHLSPTGPVGCVGFNTLHELTQGGCKDFEFWRRAEWRA